VRCITYCSRLCMRRQHHGLITQWQHGLRLLSVSVSVHRSLTRLHHGLTASLHHATSCSTASPHTSQSHASRHGLIPHASLRSLIHHGLIHHIPCLTGLMHLCVSYITVSPHTSLHRLIHHGSIHHGQCMTVPCLTASLRRLHRTPCTWSHRQQIKRMNRRCEILIVATTEQNKQTKHTTTNKNKQKKREKV